MYIYAFPRISSSVQLCGLASVVRRGRCVALTQPVAMSPQRWSDCCKAEIKRSDWLALGQFIRRKKDSRQSNQKKEIKEFFTSKNKLLLSIYFNKKGRISKWRSFSFGLLVDQYMASLSSIDRFFAPLWNSRHFLLKCLLHTSVITKVRLG